MNVLGLDVSTSTIGFAIVNENGLVVADYVKPTGDTLYEKVDSAVTILKAKIGDIKIDQIVAEAPNIMFQSGQSSASTISKILRFNGAFLFTLYTQFRILPSEIMAVSARKQVIGRGRFDKGLDAKEEVWKWVSSRIDVVWPIGRTGKMKPERFDVADAYIIAMSGLNGRVQTNKVGDTE